MLSRSFSGVVRSAFICAAVGLLAACAGTSFKWSDARQIREGMTSQEAVALMGRPYLVQSRADGVQVYIWSHASGITGASKSIAVPFQNGKVTSVPAIPSAYK